MSCLKVLQVQILFAQNGLVLFVIHVLKVASLTVTEYVLKLILHVKLGTIFQVFVHHAIQDIVYLLIHVWNQTIKIQETATVISSILMEIVWNAQLDFILTVIQFAHKLILIVNLLTA